jgi:hypothetical protein
MNGVGVDFFNQQSQSIDIGDEKLAINVDKLASKFVI